MEIMMGTSTISLIAYYSKIDLILLFYVVKYLTLKNIAIWIQSTIIVPVSFIILIDISKK